MIFCKSLILFMAPALAFTSTKTDLAKKQIEKVISDAGYKGGVAIKNLRSGAEIVIHGDDYFPMASVFKFPIAIAVLKMVDDGKLKHSQKFHLGRHNIQESLGGPLAKKYAKGEANLTLDELLNYMVSDSDNNACDFLLGVVGGPEKVTAALRKLQIEKINVNRTEAEFAATSNDPGPKNLDAATPRSMIQLYEKFRDGNILNYPSTTYLLKLMRESRNPPHIQNGLPRDLVVAHKSGWCNKSACINDTGLIALPDGRGYIVMAIFLDGELEMDSGSAAIGKIARLGFAAIGD